MVSYTVAGPYCRECEFGVPLGELRIYCVDSEESIIITKSGHIPTFCAKSSQYRTGNVNKWKGEYLDVR